MSIDFAAFLDELEKIAAVKAQLFSRSRMRQFATRLKDRHRQGVRPLKATTAIKKNTPKYKLGEYNPTMGNASAPQPWMVNELSAQPKKKRGDVPTRDDIDGSPKTMDGRANAATVYGPGSQANSADQTNSPAGNN